MAGHRRAFGRVVRALFAFREEVLQTPLQHAGRAWLSRLRGSTWEAPLDGGRARGGACTPCGHSRTGTEADPRLGRRTRHSQGRCAPQPGSGHQAAMHRGGEWRQSSSHSCGQGCAGTVPVRRRCQQWRRSTTLLPGTAHTPAAHQGIGGTL